MSSPIESLRFVHAAIVRETELLEEVAGPRGAVDHDALDRRVAFFQRLMEAHTRGEELGLFPRVAEKAPKLDEAYLFDHEHERDGFGLLRQAITERDDDAVRRQLIVLGSHTKLHVEKENALILPFVADAYAPAEQGAIVQAILSAIPPADTALAIPWIVSRLAVETAEAYVRVLQAVMPAPAFAMAKGWIRDGVPADQFAAVAARVPELAS